jgi:predicted HAD superfamily Cof-like phosphohydrolase
MSYTTRVREFTSACQDELPEVPILLSEEQIRFITTMVNDELQELEDAENEVEQADALVDAIYYICDTAVRHGMNLDPLFDIVHNANMQKVVDGKVIRRPDGKIMKPDCWEDPAPKLDAEIKRQMTSGAFNAES